MSQSCETQSCATQSCATQSCEIQSSLSFSTTIAGAGAAVFLFATVMAGADHALAQSSPFDLAGRDTRFLGLRPQLQPVVPEIKAILQPGDAIAALEAVDIALTQAGDGATYVWRHDNGRINGAIRMTATFRDADGRICRHLEMMLNSGTYSRQRNGIACRQPDGGWELAG